MNRAAFLLAAALALLTLPASAQTRTKGAMTFSFTSNNQGQKYDPKNVMVVWITDDSDTFVKTLEKNAGSRQNYLYKWIASPAAKRDVVDGFTGATLGSHQTHTVAWDCTDASTPRVVVPDGWYRLRVEFTTYNGQGPWTPTNYIRFYKGTNPVSLSPANYNYTIGSSRLAMSGMSLTYTPPPPNPTPNTLVSANSTWRYNDQGTNLHASAWKTHGYNDDAWSAGLGILGYANTGVTTPNLGYGSDANNKYPCYYFRKKFTASAVPNILKASLLRDDGAVVYLNGHEILRDNMPAGATAYAQYASASVGGTNENYYYEYTLDNSLVAVGENILAVELHQNAANSSDLSFDLELKAGGAIAASHDLAASIQVPAEGTIGTTLPIPVTVTNKTGTLEYVMVTLSNLTTHAQAAAPISLHLDGNASTNLLFSWSTTGLSAGVHQLQARATPIAGEASVADNTATGAITLRSPVHDVRLVSVATDGGATAGDTLDVAVTVENRGTYTENITITLVDTNTTQVVGFVAVSSLTAGSFQVIHIPWSTLGAAIGAHGLRATIGGAPGDTTPADNTLTVSGVVATTGFDLAAVGASGSLGGHCAAVAAQGGGVAVGAGSSLVMVKVDQPASPAVLGRLRLAGPVRSVAWSGTLVAAAAGSGGVQLVDVSDPAAPVLRSSFNTSGEASGVALSGSTLYVADGLAGVRILDVADPVHPSLAGSLATEGPARAITVNGTLLYVLDEKIGLLVVDAASPASPVLLGIYGGARQGRALVANGTTVYAADGAGWLRALDAGMPGAIAERAAVRLAAPGRGIARSGSLLFVAAGEAGLLVIDASSPTNLVVQTAWDTPAEASALALLGTDAFLADGAGGLRVVNVAAPAAPTLRAALDIGFRVSDAAAVGNLAFLAAGEAGLRVVDLTDPAHPILVGQSTAALNARDVAADGVLAVVADLAHGLRIFDVSHPAVPVLLATWLDSSFGPARRVALHGTKAAVTDGRAVKLLDLTNTASPVVLDTWSPVVGYVHDLAMNETLLLAAAGRGGLAVLGTASGNLAQFATHPVAGLARSVALAGSHAYVAGERGGWTIVDLASPSSPSTVAADASAPSFAVAAGPDRLHTGTGTTRAASLDVTNPLTPVETGRLQPLVRALRLSARGALLLVAEDDTGLAVLDARPGDHDHDGMKDAAESAVVDADPDDALRSIEDVAPGDDYDHDGCSNGAEAVAGTDPSDPASVFAFAPSTPAPGQPIVVRWHSQAGRTYSVWRATDLGGSFTRVAPGLPADPPVNEWPDPDTDAPGAFYLITVD